MLEVLAIVTVVLLLVVVVLAVLILRHKGDLKLEPLNSRFENLVGLQERTERTVREEIARNRDESATQARNLRDEVQISLKTTSDSLVKTLDGITSAHGKQFEAFGTQLKNLTESNERKLENLKATVESKLTQIQSDNSQKLEEMRKTVDEKLQGTLDKRLGESFKLVSDRLEKVHQGLGEMQALAIGVGDLKKVLTNVKTRGTWGEIQLGSLLEQVLTPEQYAKNVQVKEHSAERVEFAVKLPGSNDEKGGKPVWLPIDSKFPREDYERIVEAADRADIVAVESATRDLEIRIKSEAKDIHEKYLDPPNTTDFGILFLPTEGLYAEALRRPGLMEILQREYRVIIAGPTTLAALLNSLQMGFRTLAIQKRSSEVWTLLGAVKTEFGNFGAIIEKVQKKLQEASNAIDSAASKTKTIQRKLKNVQELSVEESTKLLPIESEDPADIQPLESALRLPPA
jgi:DNA recombination protein RmuC